MATVAAIALGLVWAGSALLKLRAFDSFARDVHEVVPLRPRNTAALVLLVELLLAAALLMDVFRGVAAAASVGFLLVLTASFVLRAHSKLTVTCACFGSRQSNESLDRVTGWQGIRRSLSLVVIFLRNAAFVSLAATAAGMTGAIPGLVVVTWLLLALAYVVSVVGLQRQRRTVPHPALATLKRRRRTLFATYWHNDLWTSWMICFPD